MRILLVANKDITLYLFRKEFIEKLVEKNYEVFILCPNGEKLEYFRKFGITIINYQLERRGMNPFNEIKVIRKFRKVLKSVRPDFVFTYTIKPNLYIGMLSRVRKFKFIPTITGLGSSANRKGYINFLIKHLYRYSFKKVHVAFFQNTDNLQWFNENISAKIKTTLVNGSGVNLTQFSYNQLQQDKVTKFLFLGRIMKEKGIDELFQAAKILKQKYNDAIQFTVAGFIEEDYRDLIQNLVNDNIISYIGFVDDSHNELIKHTALVLPSYHEGLSNVILEAQATGRPVIASDIPGCREAFVDGVSGFKIKVKDVDDLVLKLETFHNLGFGSKNNMSIKGRQFIETHYDRDKVVRDYINIIEIGD